MFGTSHDREIKQIQPLVEKINALESELVVLDDKDLKARALALKESVTKGALLDDVLPEAFAICRESADRRLGMLNIFKESVEFDFSQLSDTLRSEAEAARDHLEQDDDLLSLNFSAAFYDALRQAHPDSRWPYRMRCFDVQLIGGVILHRGVIAEMKTGEGKTLVATLAVYLNALNGKGVHVVTTNDYLAKVGAEDNRPLYEFLGLTVGVIVNGLNEKQRRESYAADVTYGTNNEFGFDYLRDNMARNIEDCVQRDLNFSIVDEVDSILIDEARTPLIISGPAEESADKYMHCDNVVKKLQKETHYTVDEKSRHVGLTEEGVNHCESALQLDNLYGDLNTEWVHHLTQALKAHVFFKRDVDYVVKNREVVIVDEFTGRMMEGRRYSEGLHQAIEAKERVPIARENQTLATITFQNYFRMYDKLAGMTGTADTEATEFTQIYKLRVVVIPTNKPMIRDDSNDLIYKSHAEKIDAIVEDIQERYKNEQPILVGTVSIEKSEEISKKLDRVGVKHDVLNAKQHDREAIIIENAGQKGHVTIATNMAGRGVDIRLGPGVIELGGLYVLGTERHEARRIDNQLRGRAGRQGDPGASQFYLSLEDELMRIFGSTRIATIMDKLGAQEGEVITHPWVNKAIANAQKRVEAQNFEMRKHLLEYDDVMNQQRSVIYRVRRLILKGEEVKDEILTRIEDSADIVISEHAISGKYPEVWDLEVLYQALKKSFAIDYRIPEEELSGKPSEGVVDDVIKLIKQKYEEVEKAVGEEHLREIERQLLLMIIDNFWKEHLNSMDHLKDAIRFRGYAQKDPLQEYKKEGLTLFENTMDRIAVATAERLMHVDTEFMEKQRLAMARAAEIEELRRQNMSESSEELTPFSASARQSNQAGGATQKGAGVTTVRSAPKVGRNSPCPCGSGKKYKKCCGRV
ncbi:MAG: preprotein translocase subunit SecA [Fibrobacteria bacterium]|nr:preprotein translocase subunit SecA [Fibrobacteria bacterium]